MTSQKSLNSKVNLKDFLRSLKGSVLFPVLAMLVVLAAMTFPVITYVTSEDFVRAVEHTEISLFSSGEGFDLINAALMPGLMVVCGFFTAWKSFYFLMSKKQTNVYLSLGMTRTRMFLNRYFAGVVTLLLAALIPLTTTLLINIASFGYSAQLLKVYLYLVSVLAVSGVAGLSVGALASVITGNIFETALTTGVLSVIPLLLFGAYNMLEYRFLHGFWGSRPYDEIVGKLITPFTFAVNMKTKLRFDSAVGVITNLLKRGDTPADKFKIPEELVITRWWIIPLLIWLAASALIAVCAVLLLKKRKAEKANSFGQFNISATINSLAACTLAIIILVDLGLGVAGSLAVISAVTLVLYLVLQLIFKRKLKPVLKSLAFYGVFAAVYISCALIINSEYFGTFNKVPGASEVKTVQIEVNVGSGVFNAGLPNTAAWDGIYGYDALVAEPSSDLGDIDMVRKIFKSVASDKPHGKEEPLPYDLKLLMVTKDGKEIKRSFEIYSPDVFLQYQRDVFSSKYFHAVLKTYLIDGPKQPEKDGEYEYGYENGGEYIYYPNSMAQTDYRQASWTWFDGSFLKTASGDEAPVLTNRYYENGTEYTSTEIYEDGEQPLGIPDPAGLCKALYEDLVRLDFDAVYKNNARPVGAISMGTTYAANADGTVSSADGITPGNEVEYKMLENVLYPFDATIYVYPEMTSTLKFLRDNGINTKPTYEGKIKEVLYTDSKLSFSTVIEKARSDFYDYKTFGYIQVWFDMTHMGSGDFEHSYGLSNTDITVTDFYKKLYMNCEHPLAQVTDAVKAEEIYNACVPFYTLLGDSGRYVFVVYEDGPIVQYYLPEANLDVLK